MKKWPKEWSRKRYSLWQRLMPRVYHISSKDNENGQLHVQKQNAYITRWIFWGGRTPWAAQILVNQIHHTDINDCKHDHPWDFWTFVLWGGYVEEVRRADGTTFTQRRWPGQLSFRPAEHTHVIKELPWGKSYTLVFQYKKRREFGYYTREGWMHYKKFLHEMKEKGIAWCRPIRDDE